MQHSPPRLARKLLHWFVNAEYVEEIEGDLEEVFYERLTYQSLLKARLHYFLDVLRAIRPYQPKRKSSPVAHEIVHWIFLKLAFRTLAKRKVFSVINVSGLSVGLVSFLLIMEYVAFERSYDSFHHKGDSIYRVAFNWGETDYKGENSSIYASSVPALGPAVAEAFPEIDAYTRFVPVLTVKPYCVFNVFQKGRLKYTGNADNGFYADSAFLKIFSFPIVAGHTEPLSKPYSIAITQSYAEKIFGTLPYSNILGSSIEVDAQRKEDHVITAIVADPPANSHIHFDYLISYATINSSQLEGNLGWSQFYTYIVSNQVLSDEWMEPRFQGLVEKLYGNDSHIVIFLQPLRQIYLESKLREEVGPSGSSQQLMFLTIIAYTILLMAWINYINMFLARSMERLNEIAVKKVLGSTRSHLVVQFFAESILLNVFSFGLSILLLLLFQYPFENWLGKPVSEVLLTDTPYVATVLSCILAGSIAAGLYPSLLLASRPPVGLLAHKYQSSAQGIFFKKGLLYFQFIVSFILVSGTLIIDKQIEFMKKANLGMELSGCVAIRSPGTVDSTYHDRLEAFKARLLTSPFIKNVCSSSTIPGVRISKSGGVQRVVGPELDGNNVFFLQVDENFLSTYDIRLIAGRNFSDKPSGLPTVILNEAALQTLKFNSPEEALNHRIHWQLKEYVVIGVFANYNHLFLKETFEPIMLSFRPSTPGYLTLKIQDGHTEEALAIAKQQLQSLFPSTPFEYSFLESTYNRQYQPVQQFESLAKYFSLLAITISCLGLFALSYYAVQKRLMEIAVRKVFGARSFDILLLLSKSYLKITVISGVVGSSFTFYLMNEWLQNFAFATALDFFDFLIPFIFITGIVLTTISYNCLRTFFINPSHSLKHN